MHNQSLPPADRPERSAYNVDEKLRQRLMAMRDAEGSEWTNSKIAAEIGMSGAVLSQYLSKDGNKYTGDLKNLEAKLFEFVRDLHLSMDTGVETVDCEISKKIEKAVEEIRTAKRIGLIVGEPGIGKSRGIALYCAEHERAISFIVRSWRRNQKCVEECLFNATGGVRDGGTQALADISRGSSRPILVDDAHKMTSAGLQLLYDFRDETGCPVVLFGDERLVTKCRADKQRLRRTGNVTRLEIEDSKALVEHHVKTLCGDVNGESKDLIKLCSKIAEKSGHFGSLQMQLSFAARLKMGSPDMSWCEAVKRAHSRLIRDYSLEPLNTKETKQTKL